MLIEKRARLNVKELVLITKDNLQEVADWCGGIVDRDSVLFTDNTCGAQIDMFAFIGEYIEKSERGFESWTPSFISSEFNRNEKGELIENEK